MRRLVCVWFPHLPIERLTRERLHTGHAPPPAKVPFALVGSDTHGLTLTALNIPCQQEGLSPGMRLADARAICPTLLTEPDTPGKDAVMRDERFGKGEARHEIRRGQKRRVRFLPRPERFVEAAQDAFGGIL